MDDFGNVLVVLVLVLGGLTAVFGLVYAWIYFTKIRPRPKAPPDDQRISHFHRKPDGSFKNNENGNVKKTHPFFVLSAVSKMTPSSGNQRTSTTSSRVF